MKITKAKLEKGTYLAVMFMDGSAENVRRYPHTEAPPKLQKAFMALNHHVCDLTEQYDSTGQPDYDNIACRGYSIKGEDEKEGIVLTGVRSLKTGKSITLNTPFVGLEISDSSYGNIKTLVECIDRCRDEIAAFMENNKSPEEIQGKLFDKNNTFVVKSEKTAEEEANELPEETKAVIAQIISEQERMDHEMPLTVDMQKAAEARKKRAAKNNS